MKNIIAIMALCLAAIIITACGGEKAHTPDPQTEATVQEQNTRLAKALNTGSLTEASAMADSMSLCVDDLTPEQTVQVLMAFIKVHNDAVERKQSRRDLETLRKFVDVYDIALSVNPRDTREAFAKAKEVNPAIDFDSIATDFRERLTQYDAIHDGSLNAVEPETTDSVNTDSLKVAEEIPVELRPAS